MKTRAEKFKDALDSTSWADKSYVLLSRYGEWRTFSFKDGECWFVIEPTDHGYIRSGGDKTFKFFDSPGGPFISTGSKVSSYINVDKEHDKLIANFEFDEEKKAYKLELK